MAVAPVRAGKVSMLENGGGAVKNGRVFSELARPGPRPPPPPRSRGADRVAQAGDLLRTEGSEAAGGEIAPPHPSIADPPQLGHGVAGGG